MNTSTAGGNGSHRCPHGALACATVVQLSTCMRWARHRPLGEVTTEFKPGKVLDQTSTDSPARVNLQVQLVPCWSTCGAQDSFLYCNEQDTLGLDPGWRHNCCSRLTREEPALLLDMKHAARDDGDEDARCQYAEQVRL